MPWRPSPVGVFIGSSPAILALVVSCCLPARYSVISVYCCKDKPSNFWQDIYFTLPYYSSNRLYSKEFGNLFILEEFEEKTYAKIRNPAKLKGPHSLYAMP